MVEAVVEYEYTAQEEDELTIKVGEIIKNVTKEDGGWWRGQLNGKEGMFPDNFVKEIRAEEPSPRSPRQANRGGHGAGGNVAALAGRLGKDVKMGPAPNILRRGDGGGEGMAKKMMRAKVTYSYSPANQDELPLNTGDIVDVLKQDEEGWWYGSVDGKTGMFPSNFVEVVEDASISGEPEKPDKLEGGDGQGEISGKKIRGVGLGNIFSDGPIKLRAVPRGSPATNASENKKKAPSVPSQPPVLPPREVKAEIMVTVDSPGMNQSRGQCFFNMTGDSIMGYESDTSHLEIFDFSDDSLRKPTRKMRTVARASPYSCSKSPRRRARSGYNGCLSPSERPCFYNMTGNEIMAYGPHESFSELHSLPSPSPAKRPKLTCFYNITGDSVMMQKLDPSAGNVENAFIKERPQAFYSISGSSVMKYDTEESVIEDNGEALPSLTPCREQCFFNMTGSAVMSLSYDSDASFDNKDMNSVHIFVGSSPDTDLRHSILNHSMSAEDVPVNLSALSNTRETPPPRMTFQRRRKSRGTPRQSSTPVKVDRTQIRKSEPYDAHNSGDNVCHGIGIGRSCTREDEKNKSAYSGDNKLQSFTTPESLMHLSDIDSVAHSDGSKKCVSFTARDEYILEEKSEAVYPSRITGEEHATPEHGMHPLSNVTDSIKITRHRMFTPTRDNFEDKGVQVSMMAEETLARKLVETQLRLALLFVSPKLQDIDKYKAIYPLYKIEKPVATPTKLPSVQESKLEGNFEVIQPPEMKKTVSHVQTMNAKISVDMPKPLIGDAELPELDNKPAELKQSKKRRSLPILSGSWKAKLLLQRKTSKPMKSKEPLSEQLYTSEVIDQKIQASVEVPENTLALKGKDAKPNNILTYFEFLYKKGRVPRFVKHIQEKYGIFKDGHIGYNNDILKKDFERSNPQMNTHKPGCEGDMEAGMMQQLPAGKHTRRRWWLRKKSKSFSGLESRKDMKSIPKRKSAESTPSTNVADAEIPPGKKTRDSQSQKTKRQSLFNRLSIRRRRSSNEKDSNVYQKKVEMAKIFPVPKDTVLSSEIESSNVPVDSVTSWPTEMSDISFNSLGSLPLPDNSAVQEMLASEALGKWVYGTDYNMYTDSVNIKHSDDVTNCSTSNCNCPDAIGNPHLEPLDLEEPSIDEADTELDTTPNVPHVSPATEEDMMRDIQGFESSAENTLVTEAESDNKESWKHICAVLNDNVLDEQENDTFATEICGLMGNKETCDEFTKTTCKDTKDLNEMEYSLTGPSSGFAEEFVSEIKDAYEFLRSSRGSAGDILDRYSNRNIGSEGEMCPRQSATSQPQDILYDSDDFGLSSHSSIGAKSSSSPEISPLLETGQEISPGQVHLGFDQTCQMADDICRPQHVLDNRASRYRVEDNLANAAIYADESEAYYEPESPMVGELDIDLQGGNILIDEDGDDNCLEQQELGAVGGVNAQQQQDDSLPLTPESMDSSNFDRLIGETGQRAQMYYSLTSGDLSPSTSASYESSREGDLSPRQRYGIP